MQQLKKLGVNPEKGRLRPWNVYLRCLKPGLRGRAGPLAGISRRQDLPQNPGQLCSVTWISQAVSGGSGAPHPWGRAVRGAQRQGGTSGLAAWLGVQSGGREGSQGLQRGEREGFLGALIG